MPELIEYAKDHGVEAFFLTGLGEDKREAAVENLAQVGVYTDLDADHAFLEDMANPPSWLSDRAAARELESHHSAVQDGYPEVHRVHRLRHRRQDR
ncbi:hypothetical protein ACIQ6R_27850 [Streptomyces sp. NPDC096048]|uniref:hypothetical protein n=1 Tax=Streptomyces sp. NPDC096048 TaxID=3366072 RepID=UPI00382B37FC